MNPAAHHLTRAGNRPTPKQIIQAYSTQ